MKTSEMEGYVYFIEIQLNKVIKKVIMRMLITFLCYLFYCYFKFFGIVFYIMQEKLNSSCFKAPKSLVC